MFYTEYIIWEYLFYIWIKSFKSRYFTLYKYSISCISFMSVKQVAYTRSFEFHAQVHRDQDGRKPILFPFIILQKHNDLLLLWVHTNKCRVFTDLQSILRASDCTSANICPAVSALLFSFHTLHRHLNSAHFSRLTLDWAAM